MVVLPCATYAKPPAIIQWSRENVESSELDKHVIFDGSLQFKAKFSDRGKYLCEAINEAGAASSEIVLNVYGKDFFKNN